MTQVLAVQSTLTEEGTRFLLNDCIPILIDRYLNTDRAAVIYFVFNLIFLR